MDELIKIMDNPDFKKYWVPNYEIGHIERHLSENVRIDYVKTKKVAVISSRDMYMVLMKKFIQPEKSPTGKKLVVIAGKSCDLPCFPEHSGVVRAVNYMSGYYIEELGPSEVKLTFVVESDFKISMFI